MTALLIIDVIDPIVKIATSPTTWTTIFGIGAAALAGIRTIQNPKRSAGEMRSEQLQDQISTLSITINEMRSEQLQDQVNTLSVTIATLTANSEKIVKELDLQIKHLTNECLELRAALIKIDSPTEDAILKKVNCDNKA